MEPRTFRLGDGCSASTQAAPDGSSLLTLEAPVAPDGSRPIVCMIIGMIRAHPSRNRLTRPSNPTTGRPDLRFKPRITRSRSGPHSAWCLEASGPSDSGQGQAGGDLGQLAARRPDRPAQVGEGCRRPGWPAPHQVAPATAPATLRLRRLPALVTEDRFGRAGSRQCRTALAVHTVQRDPRRPASPLS